MLCPREGSPESQVAAHENVFPGGRGRFANFGDVTERLNVARATCSSDETCGSTIQSLR